MAKPNLDALKNYKPTSVYPSPKQHLIDMIIKKGFARYEAEAWLDVTLKLFEHDPVKVAQAIVLLKKGDK